MTVYLRLLAGLTSLHLEAVLLPLLLDRAGGDVRLQLHAARLLDHFTIPASTARGKEMLPITMMAAKIQAPTCASRM